MDYIIKKNMLNIKRNCWCRFISWISWIL